MDSNNNVVVFAVIVVGVIAVWYLMSSSGKKKDEKFESAPNVSFSQGPFGKYATVSTPSTLEFDNSMYQYANPTLPVEDDYYRCLVGMCGGVETASSECMAMCKIKAFRGNSPGAVDDIQTRTCAGAPSETDFYRCMMNLFANYKYPA